MTTNIFKFEKETYICLDRSYIDFEEVEYKVKQPLQDGEVSVKITKKGMKTLKENINGREWKYGSDYYLIEFVEEDLDYNLWFGKYESEPQVYAQVMQRLKEQSNQYD